MHRISIAYTVLASLLQSGYVYAENQQAVTTVARSSIAIQVVLGLLLVTSLIVVLAWLVKKIGYRAFLPQKNMRIIASLPLTHREKAVLVQVGETQLLLGVAPGRVSRLHVLAENIADNSENLVTAAITRPTAPANEPRPSEFSHYLKNLFSQGHSP